MTTALQIAIEDHLLSAGDWVSVDQICERFGIEERILRADGKRRPICRHFAISSSTRGFKHLAHTTASERIAYKHARKKSLIAHARALKEFDAALHNCLHGRPAVERLTGQTLLFQT